MPYFVYIVRCIDDSLYTGITKDLGKRVDEHNTSKLGAKAVKGKLPVKLVYSESHIDRSEASKRESQIKSLSKKKKEELILQ